MDRPAAAETLYTCLRCCCSIRVGGHDGTSPYRHTAALMMAALALLLLALDPVVKGGRDGTTKTKKAKRNLSEWAKLAEREEKAEIEADAKAMAAEQNRTRESLHLQRHDDDGGVGVLSDYVKTDNDRLKAAILLGENDKVKKLLAESAGLDLEHDTRQTAEVVKAGFFPPGTALMCAVFASNTEAIELLLRRGANHDTGGADHHMSPTETAAFRADGKAMRALYLGGCDLTGYGPHGYSFLHLVARSEREAGQPAACVKWLVTKVGMAVDTPAREPSSEWGTLAGKNEHGAVPGMTPLMSAVAIKNQLAVVKALLTVSVMLRSLACSPYW